MPRALIPGFHLAMDLFDLPDSIFLSPELVKQTGLKAQLIFFNGLESLDIK